MDRLAGSVGETDPEEHAIQDQHNGAATVQSLPAPRTAWDRVKVPLLFSVTIGLAPFAPEPHVIMGARHLVEGTMSGMDWVELLGHGAPWAVLIWRLVAVTRDQLRAKA